MTRTTGFSSKHNNRQHDDGSVTNNNNNNNNPTIHKWMIEQCILWNEET
ncbi:unnamed protein product, partial [Brassica rapa subsp. narinosa]